MAYKDLTLKAYFSRRHLFRFVSAGILAAPLMRLFRWSEAYGAGEDPFTLLIYIPAGIEKDSWFPRQLDLSGPFPKVSQPLQRHREDLIFFEGFNTIGPTNHSGGPKQVFAGGGADNTPLNSLDQILSLHDRSHPFSRVAIGLVSSLPSDGNYVSWRNDQGIMTNDNPKLMFENLFGTQGNAFQNQDRMSQWRGQKRVIDAVKADFSKLKQVLGQEEKEIYESHVEAIDELNQELDRLISGSGSQCQALDLNREFSKLNMEKSYWPYWYHKVENIPTIAKINRQMMLQALKCGLTKVGLLQFGASNTLVPLNFDGYPETNDAHHNLSHMGGEPYQRVQQAIVSEAALLIDELKKESDGHGGRMLDQGLIYMASCLGDNPNYHNGTNIPCFIAGRAKGRLRTGQLIRKQDAMYNHILVTVAQAAGHSIETVGHQEFRGPVKEALNS